MNSIKTKILTGILSATLLFSAVGFSACGNGEQAAKLAELELKLLQQQTQIADIAQEKEDLAEQLTAQIEKLEEENEDLQLAINALEQQNDSLLLGNTELQNQLNELKQQNEAMNSNVSTLEQENQELREQILEKEQEILDLQNNITEIKSSFLVNCYDYRYGVAYSWVGPAITFNCPDAEAEFYCTTYKGYIFFDIKEERNKSLNIKSDKGFWWRPNLSGTEQKAEKDYIDIIIKSGEKIIGYAVIEIYPLDSFGHFFKARNLASVLFGKVDGEYQNVTEEYVKEAIAKVKE